jgi:uncharacterized membrane protein YeaQ/YmgE (transglycosylase-associated protein family)
LLVGLLLGLIEGEIVGETDGLFVGWLLGDFGTFTEQVVRNTKSHDIQQKQTFQTINTQDLTVDGDRLGLFVGLLVGLFEGEVVGHPEGPLVGDILGD